MLHTGHGSLITRKQPGSTTTCHVLDLLQTLSTTSDNLPCTAGSVFNTQNSSLIMALQVLWEIMRDLGMGAWTVKLNHRRLLDAMMRVCGVPPDKFRATCSAIDKLDKEPWSAVEAEMVETKGLPREVRDTDTHHQASDYKHREAPACLSKVMQQYQGSHAYPNSLTRQQSPGLVSSLNCRVEGREFVYTSRCEWLLVARACSAERPLPGCR